MERCLAHGLAHGFSALVIGCGLGEAIEMKIAVKRARQQELERLGITQEMLDAA